MVVEKTIVDRLYEEFMDLLSFLDERQEVSLRNTADSNFKKTIIMASASYFEIKICDDIISFVEEISQKNTIAISLTKNKTIKRQYHTYFDWSSKNANQFFGLFGETFKEYMQDQIKQSDWLNDSIYAFMELGSERNRLVHQNYASYSIEKTAAEIYDSYLKASRFVWYIPEALRSSNKGSNPTKVQNAHDV